MSSITIVKKYQNAIVSIQAGLGSDINTGSGYIYRVKHGRLYIITCAHLLLGNQGLTVDAPIYETINVNLTNIYLKGKKNSQNVICSAFILGLDKSADIGVLCTYKSDEVDKLTNLFGFNFSNKNTGIPFAPTKSIIEGTPIGIIANEYGTGFDVTNGVISKSSFVYAASNPDYINNTAQLISNCDVAEGSSGAPILTLEGVVGMACWYKLTGGSYVGGPNYVTLESSIGKILQLNHNPSPVNSGINFDGNTGSGFLGIESYIPYQGADAETLCLNYPQLANCKQSSQLTGLILTSITDPILYPIVIPDSRIQNAQNLKTKQRTGLQVDDIILVVNGIKVGYSITTTFVNVESYYNVNSKIIIEIFRPSTGEYMKFEVIPDKFPSKMDFVSNDNTIELISNSNIESFLPPGAEGRTYFHGSDQLVVYPCNKYYSDIMDNNISYNFMIISVITGLTTSAKKKIVSLEFTHCIVAFNANTTPDYNTILTNPRLIVPYKVTLATKNLPSGGLSTSTTDTIVKTFTNNYKTSKCILQLLNYNKKSNMITGLTIDSVYDNPIYFDTPNLTLDNFYNNAYLKISSYPAVSSNNML